MLTDEFVSDLKEFIDLCEQIQSAKDEIKLLVERKTEIETNMKTLMSKNNLTAISTPRGKITLQDKKNVKPLNKDYLSEIISSKITDKTVVDEIIQRTFDERPSVLVPKIKIIRTKET